MTQSTDNSQDDRTEAYKQAAGQLTVGIAMGLVPFLGQAIDIYDTIESAIHLYQAQKPEDKDDAKFDMVLAVVGWIPGPGDGVKKSLRIVNKDPERFAPVMFDLLRFVLKECGIETSPEALLAKIFDEGTLRSSLVQIEAAVKDSDTFEALPQSMQTVVLRTLENSRTALPAMLGIVEKKLNKWKRMQHNSSANESTRGRAKHPLPQAQEAHTASNGQARPTHGHADGSVNAQLKRQALAELTNEMAGISGEHIADYICAMTFQWGADWKGHDDGASGQWTGGKPDRNKAGKLSKGGSPKSAHAMYRLLDAANGTGIDSVWRATSRNDGKPYAIVEAKATRDEDGPKFLRRPDNTRKPSVRSKLADNAVTTASELIEPLEEDSATPSHPQKGGGGKRGDGGKLAATRTQQQSKHPTNPSRPNVAENRKTVMVQMSHEWIEENITKAVGISMAIEITRKLTGNQKNYSRHLFFSPAYHPSGSPLAHMKAKLSGSPANEHVDHDAFHYDESEIKKAVNMRKAALRNKYGNTPSLRGEN